ncbi:MAG: hypothetical protein ACHQLQ_15205 [Candidatus Acidiferrales bacterium]
MKKLAITLTILLVASMQAPAKDLPKTGAQTSPQQSADSKNMIPSLQGPGPDSSEESVELPDAPMPKDLAHERGPCPAGDSHPCALLGGFRFYEQTSLTEHDKTWGQAMSHPIMWGTATALVLSTAYDAEGTRACLRAHTCSEANPIFGKHPNRARMYGTAMPMNAVVIFAMGKLKKQGDGFPAFFITSVTTFMHCFFGTTGFAARR